jgi:hypothetical protein
VRHQLVDIAFAVAAAGSVGNAMAVGTIVQFNRAIGVDPVAGSNATTGAPILNTALGVAPGGRPCVNRKLTANFYSDRSIDARGAGLLLSGGDLISTRGTISQVKVPCSAAAWAMTRCRLTWIRAAISRSLDRWSARRPVSAARRCCSSAVSAAAGLPRASWAATTTDDLMRTQPLSAGA